MMSYPPGTLGLERYRATPGAAYDEEAPTREGDAGG